ncbi:MAG: hypothetical protein SFY56_07645 [Bacteroidota bacterium]|nr:hypothetical protein [Bacteroidota bacterium]
MGKKKRKISEDTKVRISTIDLLKSDDPVMFLSASRFILEPEYYGKAIEQIEHYPYKLTKFLSKNSVKEFKDLDFSNLLPIPFDNELTWAKTILQRNINELNLFVKYSCEFSSHLLRGDFNAAENSLAVIEKKFGQSIWLIKNRIAFTQLTQGLEAQKKYTKKVKDGLKDRSLVKFVIHWISIRNEGNTSISKFTAQFEPIINRFDPEKLLGFKDYCKYHVLGIDTLEPEEFANVLRLEYSRSLVDYFEAFLCMLRVLVLSGQQKYKSKAIHLLEIFNELLKDERIEFLNGLVNIKPTLVVGENSVNICDKFLEGRYATAYKLALDGLQNCPDNPLLILLAAHSLASSSEIISETHDTETLPLNTNFIYNLATLISKGPINASRELSDLNKITINFSCFSWSSIIKIILVQESNVFLSTSNENAMAALKVPIFHPLLLELTKSSTIYNEYFDSCGHLFSSHLTYKYFTSKINNQIDNSTNGLDAKLSALLNGIVSYSNTDYSKAIENGKFLAIQSQGYFRRKGISLVTHSYYKAGDLINTCISASDYFLKDKNVYPFLPIKEINETVKSGTDEWELVNNLIDFPILLDVIVKNVNSDSETERQFAYEDFLLRNGMTKPSELKDKLDEFDLEKVIYYLKHICVEANMDTSTSFEGGSKEVLAERLAVCRILLEIDPENVEEYKLEINKLVQKQLINKRRQEVDQSRIYIDIASVKEWSLKNLDESYNRYIAYLKHGLDFNKSENKTKRKLVDSTFELGIIPNILIPDDEVKALLKNIVDEIVSAYLSPEFGLDRFLSTRIRHGILEGYLRKPIHNHHLITKKEHKNGPYLSNDYWIQRLGIRNNPLAKEINKVLAEFSSSYDTLINNITNEWLQVYSKRKPKGLFFFDIVEEDINNLSAMIKPETPLSDFVDNVIQSLETVLIFKLVTIRDELNKVAKPKAKESLKLLQERINSFSKSINISEITNEINVARTDMQAQFDKVIEWFVPSSSGNSQPFNVEEPIRVAEETIMESSVNFKVELNSTGLEDYSIHGNLPLFVDVFVNIFDNVAKRSGLDSPIALCEVWDDTTNPQVKRVYFKVSNALSNTISISDLEQQLKIKKELLDRGNYEQNVATEINSGLFKIHKTISEFRTVEFDYKGSVDFGIEENRYQITISIPFRVFELTNEE